MKKILVIGAGRSTSYLINYLLDNAANENWEIRVGDVSLELAQQKTKKHIRAQAIKFDVNDDKQREEEIKQADIIISMLPAAMHINVAKDCVCFKKHLVTASYVSKEMAALSADAKAAGIIMVNECGLDPGIDHASAMKVIDKIHEQGAELTLFKSYCGGLVAPEYNDNPWGYKFSWNPRNVVLAGQGTAQYIENGEYKYIPYNRLFTQIEPITVNTNDGINLQLEAYANRDSLSYRKAYNISTIPTMLRGTLRMPGYCKAWNVFVKLGLTDDSYSVETDNNLTYWQFIESYLPAGKKSTTQKLSDLMGLEMDAEMLKKIEWLGIFEDKKINFEKFNSSAGSVSPAMILQDLLEEKWKLKEHDKDMIVMQHQFEYRTKKQEIKKIVSSLIVKGEDQTYTAMAKTVGLPLAIVTKLILQNKITTRGVVIPVMKEIYEPLLSELETLGVIFKES